MVIAAMKEWSKKTCIKFSETTGNVLSIFRGTGCYAQVGYHAKNMQMSVSSLCDKGTVVHLLGHVIGLPHQHSRPDRDDHLFIQYHNTALEDVLYLNYKGYDLCPFDYGSVMHFDTYGLSYNGESVFLGKTEHEAEDGLMLSPTIGADWSAPSDSDAALVNSEYGCPAKPCSTRKAQPPACNQDVVTTQAQFERTVTFKTMLTERSRAISCIWKTGAQFARNPTKVFVSTAKKIYGIVRMYPADWEGFETAALDTGKVRFFNIKDFVCAWRDKLENAF
ncbi:Protein SpAN [Amphibalanus amphitrite]|uniref:Metalloendopeptidase n=1 Tax=Amphibalanus amphitrite TaxID=1232801 RepID=A0A6A4X6P1_AMPAM|nr:Protein SpAN [Amphibalanus amphitrite]